jgi:hypothetical protein
MASIPEERAAFEQLAAYLCDAAAASARARLAQRDTPQGRALDGRLEHALDRLALLYGRGTYENLSTEEIFAAAIEAELRLATVLDGQDAAAAAARARSLLEVARGGARLDVREPAPAGPPYRGVYLEPLSPQVERSLWHREEQYLRWRDGAVLVLDEEEAAALRVGGHDVAVLFLDPGELLDLDSRGDRRALEAELERRLDAARSAPDRVGDSRDRYLLRLLHSHSVVLRNLRDRLADEHPSAHAALLPVLAGHRALLEARLAAAEPPDRAALLDPLGASDDAERDVLTHVSRWSSEPGDPAGLRGRFLAVAEAGTRLDGFERHHPE